MIQLNKLWCVDFSGKSKISSSIAVINKLKNKNNGTMSVNRAAKSGEIKKQQVESWKFNLFMFLFFLRICSWGSKKGELKRFANESLGAVVKSFQDALNVEQPSSSYHWSVYEKMITRIVLIAS